VTDTNVYWAAEADTHELVRRTIQRAARTIDSTRRVGGFDKSRRLLSAYYGRGVDGARNTSALTMAGEEGELVVATHNSVRPLVTQVLGLIAGQRPAIKPIATNTDSASLEQALLADALREYWERTLGMAQIELDVTRGGILSGSFWLIQGWNRSLGEVVALDESHNEVREGNVELLSIPWWRVGYDMLARTTQARQWVCFRKPASRFDLAAIYPHCRENLIERRDSGKDVSGKDNDWLRRITSGADIFSLDELFGDVIDQEDGVWVWELRHLPSPALPMGRLVRFVDEDTVLWDSAAEGVEYPYEELHAYEYSPERVVGTTRGHTPSFDLLGLQELQDVATTSIATSVNLFGTPHLWSADPASMNAHVMASGPVLLGGVHEPKVLQFQALNADVVGLLSLVRDMMRESAAINKVVMGEPDKGMPASAQALQRAQAVQYHQAAQGEYIKLVNDNVTGVLKLAQRFAHSQRVAEIAGLSGTHEVRSWSQKDIAGVKRFACDDINPMLRSYEARMALAENLSNKVDPRTGEPWVTKDGYLSVYMTGDIKEPLESTKTRKELVAENKTLLRKGIGLPPVDMNKSMQAGLPVFIDDGKQHVRPLKTDPHWIAFNEYRSVLDSQVTRENPEIVKAVTDVLTETLRLWASLTPDELAALGGPPLPSQKMMAMQAMGMGGAGGPPGDGPPSGGPGGPPPGAPPAPDGTKNKGLGLPGPHADLPTPPQNPLTQERQGRESLGGLTDA
jgi:hypothetical protein